MTCTYRTEEEMAEAGLTQDEIDLLRKEIELAREVAKAESFTRNETRSVQEIRMDEAEKEARKVAHDRFHRKLADINDEILKMALWQAAHPGHHYDPMNEPVAVAAGKMLDAHKARNSGTVS